MNQPVLLILAAGLGSRFGGLKQLEGLGPDGEIIMDYSIFDALNSGFMKVVLIVQEQMIPLLKDRYCNQLHLPVEFVVQHKELIINGEHYHNSKPWGTAHALWSAKTLIKENFLLINADDFYGRNSFQLAYNHLSTSLNPCAILYPILNTLSENGSVNRAEAKVHNGLLIDIVEREKIMANGELIFYSNSDSDLVALSKDALVSMNMWGFTPKIFEYIDNDIDGFLDQWNHNKALEYQLPDVVSNMISKKDYEVNALVSDEEWIGITYQQDKEQAVLRIKNLHNKGVYQSPLWKIQ